MKTASISCTNSGYDIWRLKTEGDKPGYCVGLFFNKYILTGPGKAAKNLPESFELKFFLDPSSLFLAHTF